MATEHEITVSLAEKIKKEYRESNCLNEMGLAIRLVSAGYRLDPYHNGKTKDELIKRIEELEAELDKARNLVREVIANPTSERAVSKAIAFLESTSLVHG